MDIGRAYGVFWILTVTVPIWFWLPLVIVCILLPDPVYAVLFTWVEGSFTNDYRGIATLFGPPLVATILLERFYFDPRTHDF